MLQSLCISDELLKAFGGRIATAVELAKLAGNKTLEFFQSNRLELERKSDDSPVTIADKQAELLIRNELARRYPNDSVLGEEFGESGARTSSEYHWIIDPIDGTKSFLSGIPLYSTLVGVTHNNEPLIGVIYIPALDEIVFAACGMGAWHSVNQSAVIRAKVSTKTELSDSLFVVSQVDNFFKYGAGEAYSALEKSSYITRSWGDGYGYLLVATGRAELMLDPIVNPWDVAAVLPVVEEAGGRCTDWQGVRTIRSKHMFATNASLYSQVLAITSRSLPRPNK